MKKTQQLYEGKAKKVYATDVEGIYIVDYKDDATAFNGEKKGTIAGKGVINNRVTNYLMKMLEEKYKRANEIKEEMWRLKNESNMLLKNFRGRYLCSIKPKVNRELKKQSHCIIVESDGDYLFSLSAEDLKLLSENRMKRYNELKKEFEEI